MTRRWLAAAAVCVLGGCGDSPTQLVPTVVPAGVDDPDWVNIGKTCSATSPVTVLSAARRDSAPPPTTGFLTIDDRSAAAARTIPCGYAGVFFADSQYKILLVDPTKRDAAVAGLKTANLGYGFSWDLVVAVPARWDFAQLYDWYNYLNRYHVHSVSGLNMTDIDEVKNRLHYGVVGEADRDELEALLKTLDLPCWLVAVSIEGPFGP